MNTTNYLENNNNKNSNRNIEVHTFQSFVLNNKQLIQQLKFIQTGKQSMIVFFISHF